MEWTTVCNGSDMSAEQPLATAGVGPVRMSRGHTVLLGTWGRTAVGLADLGVFYDICYESPGHTQP